MTGDPDADELEFQEPVTAEVDLPDSVQDSPRAADDHFVSEDATDTAPMPVDDGPMQEDTEPVTPEHEPSITPAQGPKEQAGPGKTDAEDGRPGTGNPAETKPTEIEPTAKAADQTAEMPADKPNGTAPAAGAKGNSANGVGSTSSGTANATANTPARGAAKTTKAESNPRERRTRTASRGQSAGDKS